MVSASALHAGSQGFNPLPGHAQAVACILFSSFFHAFFNSARWSEGMLTTDLSEHATGLVGRGLRPALSQHCLTWSVISPASSPASVCWWRSTTTVTPVIDATVWGAETAQSATTDAASTRASSSYSSYAQVGAGILMQRGGGTRLHSLRASVCDTVESAAAPTGLGEVSR